MADFSVTVSGDVYTLQVIALACDEVKELVEDNIDDLESAYEEIRDTADDNDCLHDFNFLKEGEDREIKVEDEDGNELEGDPDNYIQVKSLIPREEYKGDEEDYQNEEVANYDKLKALKPDDDYCSGYLTNAIKKAVKGTKKNLVENLVLECMKEYGEGTQFLLVYGGPTEHCYYQMDIEDDDNDEVDAYDVFLPSIERYFRVGNVDFFADSLADHVIYNGTIYGAGDFMGNNYVSDPQFQLVDANLKPIGAVEQEEDEESESEPAPADNSLDGRLASLQADVDNQLSKLQADVDKQLGDITSALDDLLK